MSSRMPEQRTSEEDSIIPWMLEQRRSKFPELSRMMEERLSMVPHLSTTPEQRTSKVPHLYLVFDEWNSGYSIRKVPLSRRSGKQPALSKGAKLPLPPVFMRVSALRGLPQFFTSAFGTKIMAMHPRPPVDDSWRVDDSFMGIPSIDVLDQICTFEAQPNIPRMPIYFPVSDDRLFALDISTFEVLRKPELRKLEHSGKPWAWQRLTYPPFSIWDVSSYGVQPDGCILVSTKKGVTFIFDAKEDVWKLYGNWAFRFTGRGHYDPSLKGFVGLSKDRATFGYLYCYTMASTMTGHTPDVKCTEHTVYTDPDDGRHVSATLVHMNPGKFCLVECLSIDGKASTDQELTVDQEFRVGPWFCDSRDSEGGGPQGGRYMYRLKTFFLSIKKEDLEVKKGKVCRYSLPHEARIGTICQDPVAFWL